MMITLHDVVFITGLPIDGKVVIGSATQDWKSICSILLGLELEDADIVGNRVNLSCLAREFDKLPEDDVDEISEPSFYKIFYVKCIN